jgi:hypothetical protein
MERRIAGRIIERLRVRFQESPARLNPIFGNMSRCVITRTSRIKYRPHPILTLLSVFFDLVSALH